MGRSCNVTCTRCGRSYRAYSPPTTIAYKLKNGKGIYCPECVRARQRENMVTVNHNRWRWQTKSPALHEWQAPCGNRIIPAVRKRCRQWLTRGCSEYRQCLDFASEQNWDGWRIA